LPPCKSFSLTNAPTLTCLNPGVRDREKDSPGQTGIHHPPRAMAALFLLVRRAASPRSTFAQISRGHACASTVCLTLQCSRNLLRRRRLSHPRGPRYQHVGLRPCRRHVFGKLHVPPHFPIFVYDTHKRSELSDRGLKFSRQRTLSRPISLRQKKGKAYPAGSIQKLGCRTKRCWCLHLERRDRHAWVDRMRRGEKNKTTAPWIELIRPALPGREGE